MPYPPGTAPADNKVTNDDVKSMFAANVRSKFKELNTEVSQRNADITIRDDYVYNDRLVRSLDIPIGHDSTPVNWLRRTVEIHKNMFMSRGFQVVSTYDTQDSDNAADDKDKQRIELENDKQKTYAEERMKLIKSIMEDNGSQALWSSLAESASTVGDACVKTYYDKDKDKFEICPIESIENIYVLWNSDNFREYDAIAYVYQVSKQKAIDDYGAPDDVTTSPMGQPMEVLSATGVSNQFSGQPMVTILEVTGKIEGWASEKGTLKQVSVGKETELNALIVGSSVSRVIDDKKDMPHYYILPNKRRRRRPWGLSDITDAAININLTYVETLSDWRTASSKVNFNKYKAYGFGPDTQIPKPEARKIEYLPLADGQDIVELGQSKADGIDWGRQLDELKEQFVRETGLSRVLFDDPSVTLNSNQALMTSMKPTSDIAEGKKQLWGPILRELFEDALETIALNKPELKDLVDSSDNWVLRIMWPSIMQKEDPVYQQMLLNRFNAGTMSVQSYLEAQGENKEEIDRIRDELNDPITAGILSHGLAEVARKVINEFIGMPPWGYVVPKVQLRGDLAPQEVGNMAHNYQWDQGPYGPAIGPQGLLGTEANQNTINSGFVTDGPGGAKANYQGPQVATPANNQPGAQPVSQPGSGATSASPQGAIDQTNQNAGQ